MNALSWELNETSADWQHDPDGNWMFGEIADGLATRDSSQFEPVVADYEDWLRDCFPGMFKTFADHHHELWSWVWQVKRGVRPPPFVGIWPRSHGKSTTAETATVAFGARQTRSYALYVSRTQAQADDHVENIGTLLESPQIAARYPSLAVAAKGKVGNRQLGWRRSRIRTQAGFTIDAYGMDSSVRGVRLESYRPDVIVCDDLDEVDDGKAVINRMIKRLTGALFPTGSSDVAILMIQNLVSATGIFGRLAKKPGEDGAADFLTTRIISGPIPAVEGFRTETEDGHTKITAGKATWDGFDIQAAENEINGGGGLGAFYREYQHRVRDPDTQLILKDWFRAGPEPEGIAWIRGWDLAISEKATADMTASVRIGFHNGQLYFAAPYAHRRSWSKNRRKMKSIILEERGVTDCHAIENNAFQELVVQDLAGDDDLSMLDIVGVPSSRDKVIRAQGWIDVAEEHGIILCIGYDWTDWIDEWENFPQGDHDDKVDAASVAYNRYLDSPPLPLVSPGSSKQESKWNQS